MRNAILQAGDPAPWFVTRASSNARYHFDQTAGRVVVLALIESAARPDSQAFLARIVQRRATFDDDHAAFYGLSVDPTDETSGRLQASLPGLRYLWDNHRVVSAAYGAVQGKTYFRHVVVLDQRLSVVDNVALGRDPTADADRVIDAVRAFIQETEPQPDLPAPVLLIPRVFEPELCRRVIDYFEQTGGMDSGFMHEVEGRTVVTSDPAVKRRRDRLIEDDALRQLCRSRIRDRVIPAIAKAFQFQATRVERYVVSRYSAEDGGFFRRHRDNTTPGTAHRRFAVSLNLNTGDYEGGQLVFPEFTNQRYGPPRGGACVFSCSLLHEATPVVAGTRYAFLPFLYDDAAAEIRRQNQSQVELGN